jgi:hypothetical protein
MSQNLSKGVSDLSDSCWKCAVERGISNEPQIDADKRGLEKGSSHSFGSGISSKCMGADGTISALQLVEFFPRREDCPNMVKQEIKPRMSRMGTDEKVASSSHPCPSEKSVVQSPRFFGCGYGALSSLAFICG